MAWKTLQEKEKKTIQRKGRSNQASTHEAEVSESPSGVPSGVALKGFNPSIGI